jgi:pimeloyl-ACP methyl ester carboxylesterase
MFEQALPRLAACGIRAIAVDTPGYGMSDVPQSPPALSEYADSFAWVASVADFVKNRV